MRFAVGTFLFWGFIVLKFVSPYVATWSWLWLLFPIVPDVAWVIMQFVGGSAIR